MAEYNEIFKFAAKAGALEGYLYQREKLESLDNWVTNIEAMYWTLPDSVRDNVRQAFDGVLRRSLAYGAKALDKETKAKLNNLLQALYE